MRTRARCSIAALCLVGGGMLAAAPAIAGGNGFDIESLPQDRIDLIDQNIVIALGSDIPGMQADAAQLIRDLKAQRPDQSFSNCVIPLMALVKNEEAESSTRILAALALDTLDSELGNFAIARTAQFTSNQRLKYICTWLAYERNTGKHPELKGMASYEPIEEGEE